MSTADIAGWQGFSSYNILKVSNRFKVFRIHAVMNTAQVVKFKKFWDLTYQKFISKPMSLSGSIVCCKRPITPLMTSCHPQPTGGVLKERTVLVNLGPEALLWWFPRVDSWHNKTPWLSWKPKVLAKGLRLAPEGIGEL